MIEKEDLKVGMRFRRKHEGGLNHITQGKVYEIIGFSFGPASNQPMIINDSGVKEAIPWQKERWELVKESNMIDKKDLKVGMKVRRKAERRGSHFTQGKVYEIIRITDEYYPVIANDLGLKESTRWVKENWELVTDQWDEVTEEIIYDSSPAWVGHKKANPNCTHPKVETVPLCQVLGIGYDTTPVRICCVCKEEIK